MPLTYEKNKQHIYNWIANNKEKVNVNRMNSYYNNKEKILRRQKELYYYKKELEIYRLILLEL